MQDKLIILTDKKQQNANTDNKVHLFVTLFAIPACRLPAGRQGKQVFLLPRQICNALYRDRAAARNKTLYTLTYYLLPINFVPRHSYNSDKLYPNGKKCAMVCSFRLCARTLPRFEFSAHSLPACRQAGIHSATPTNFIAGPLLASCSIRDTYEILTNFCNFGKISSR